MSSPSKQKSLESFFVVSPTKKRRIEFSNVQNEESIERTEVPQQLSTSTDIWYTQQEIPNIQHARRFVVLYRTLQAFDLMNEIQRVHDNLGFSTTNSKDCILSNLQDPDNRVGLGNSVITTIRQGWDDLNKRPATSMLQKVLTHCPDRYLYVPVQRAKVPTYWLSLLVANTLPDVKCLDWESQQASHRCTNRLCFKVEHLCWESGSVNQSRGNSFCSKPCKHEGCSGGHNICEGNNIHNPPCI